MWPWLAIAIALSVLSLSFEARAKEISGVAVVLSGDLLSVGKQKIRLFGIVAPPKTQSCLVNAAIMRCGIVSWAALIKIADGVFLSCDIEKVTSKKAGVIFATCYAGEHDIAEEHVRSGWAKVYSEQTDRYKVDEDDAKESNRGLWVGEIISKKKGHKEPKGSKKQKKIISNPITKKKRAATPKMSKAAQKMRKYKKVAPKKNTPQGYIKTKKTKIAAPKKEAIKAKPLQKNREAKKAVHTKHQQKKP